MPVKGTDWLDNGVGKTCTLKILNYTLAGVTQLVRVLSCKSERL